MSLSARRADVVSQDAVLFSFLFGPLRRQSTPNTDEIKECGKSTYENHEHRKHHRLDPPVASRVIGAWLNNPANQILLRRAERHHQE